MKRKDRSKARRMPAQAAAPRAATPTPATSGSAPREARWTMLLSLALILAAAIWIQKDALRAPFFADDYLFLDQTLGRSLWTSLTAPDPLGNYFRPVGRTWYFGLLSHLGSGSPVVFHAANLALLLLSVALLFLLVRRRAGAPAGAAAASVLAVHYAADVPVLWVAGCQDLIALAGALGSLLLFVAGRRYAAAGSLALALLAKETVVGAPIAAVALGRMPGESWRAAARRAWPLFATVLVWGVVWLIVISRRPGSASEIRLAGDALPAALAQLGRVTLGIEWHVTPGQPWLRAPSWVALGLILGALALAARADRGRSPGAGISRAAAAGGLRAGLGTGLIWAAVGALPVALVTPIWSAYYYLFALCGVAFALSLAVGRIAVLAALVVAGLAVASHNARGIEEFATARGAWTAQSHVNRAYLERGMRENVRFLEQLKRLRPTLPPRSTLFFAGLSGSVGLQTGDGPVARWTYRDSSLRSYFFSQFSAEKARRGPVFLVMSTRDSMWELEGARGLENAAIGMLLSDSPAPARDALRLAVE